MLTSTQTRDNAFRVQRDIGAIGQQEAAVMRVFHQPGHEGQDFTLNELGAILRLPASTISARVNELKKLGYLEESAPRFHRLPGKWRTRVTPLRLPRQGQRELFPTYADLTPSRLSAMSEKYGNSCQTNAEPL